MLKWDPNDFLICFGVEPDRDPHGAEHLYRVSSGGLSLSIRLLQHEGEIHFVLARGPESEPVIELRMMDCPAIELMQRGDEDWLEFRPGRNPDLSSDKGNAIDRGVRVRGYPHIRLELFK